MKAKRASLVSNFIPRFRAFCEKTFDQSRLTLGVPMARREPLSMKTNENLHPDNDSSSPRRPRGPLAKPKRRSSY